MKSTELAGMDRAHEGKGNPNTLEQLRRYLQVSSALSFAARAAEYDDTDLRHLHERAGDYLSAMRMHYAHYSIRQPPRSMPPSNTQTRV